MSRPCATRVDTARLFPSAGNVVPLPGPGARARVSPGGWAGRPVQWPRASARVTRPARWDRIPTRAGRAEPRGSLCRRWQRSREWLTRLAVQVHPCPGPRPGFPLFGKCLRAQAAHGGPSLQGRASPFPSHSLGGSKVPGAGDKRSSRPILSRPTGHPGLDRLGSRGDRLDPPRRVLAIGSTRSMSRHGRVPLSQACPGSVGQRSMVPSVSLSVSQVESWRRAAS